MNISDTKKNEDNEKLKSLNSNRKVLSNSVIYSISGILQKCFSFFLLPLYTAFLSTEDYGVTNIASSFLNTASFIVSLSLYSAVMRFYVDYKNDKEKLKRFYGTVISFVFVSSILFISVLSIGRRLLSKYIFVGVSFFPTIAICLLSLVFFCQHAIYDNILRSQQKAIKCSILSVLYFLVTVAGNIVFVVYFKMGANGVLLSILIATFLYTCAFAIDVFLQKSVTICIDFRLLKDALHYSIPIVPHDLSTILVDLLSKVLIGGANSLSAVGLYSIAVQFGSISDTLQYYVNQAYTPWLFEQLKNKNEECQISIGHVVRMLCSTLGLFIIGIGLFSQDYIFLFLESSYKSAWHYVPLIIIVYSIKMIYYFYVSIILYYKQAAKRLFIATLSGSLINALLSAAAIPLWGTYGSIAADTVGIIIRVTIVYFISIKCEGIGLHIADFIKCICIIFVFMFFGLLPSYIYHIEAFNILNFMYKSFLILTYLIILITAYKEDIKILLKRTRQKRQYLNK